MTHHRLIVGPAALAVVTRVGPSSWVVLEHLALNARVEGEAVVADASVRSLAAEFGWAKDTVAHALARLRDDGLVEFVGDRFRPGAYRLVLPGDALHLERAVAHQRPRGDRDAAAAQLSLLHPG